MSHFIVVSHARQDFPPVVEIEAHSHESAASKWVKKVRPSSEVEIITICTTTRNSNGVVESDFYHGNRYSGKLWTVTPPNCALFEVRSESDGDTHSVEVINDEG